MPGLATLFALAFAASPGASSGSIAVDERASLALTSSTVASSLAETSSASAQAQRPGITGALGDAPITVTADRLVADSARGVYLAEGDVTIIRLGTVLRADRVVFNEAEKTAQASGGVVVVDGRGLLFCHFVTMRLPELRGRLENVVLYVKGGLSPELGASLSRDALTSYGKSELTLQAEALERKGNRRFDLEGGGLTACRCAEGEAPTWSISARSGTLDLDSGAFLSWPVFYAKGVPFFALPAFYVPLGSRRTGLLLPRIARTQPMGFAIHAPLFLALSESWDATLEPGFMLSRGFSGLAELRWAPSTRTKGEFRATGLLDRGIVEGTSWVRKRDQAIPRYAFSGRHHTGFDGSELSAELNLYGDPAYGEFADRYLTRRAEYAQSRMTLAGRSNLGVRWAFGLALLEDLRPESYAALGRELRDIAVLSGQKGPGDIRYRFGELRVDAPLAAVPWTSDVAYGEATLKVDLFAAPRPDTPRFARADLRPRLIAPIRVGGLFVVEPYVALRLTGSAGRVDGESDSASRVAMIGGARAATEIFRDFGTLRHTIRPSVEYRIIPFVERQGTADFDAYDEIDRLETASQVLVRVRNELIERSGRRLAGLDARIGRDFSFRGRPGAGTSELVIRADYAVPMPASPIQVSLDGGLALDPDDGARTELLAGLVLTGFGSSLAASYGDFAARPTEYPLAGPEELVIQRLSPLSLVRWNAFRGLALALRFSLPLWQGFGRVNLGVDANLVFEPPANRPVDPHGPVFLRDTRSTLGWTSSCECFGIAATVTTDRSRPGFDFASILLDLGRLGGVRAE